MRAPAPVEALSREIVKVLSPELLRPEWAVRAVASCNPLTGQCVNASGAFWYLVGGTASGWRYRRITAAVWPEGGPHYFLEHPTTGLLLDLTAGQFSGRIPYELAEGGAPATRGRDASGAALPPVGARVVVDRVLSSAAGRKAVEAARAWSMRHNLSGASSRALIAATLPPVVPPL
jgi:hypothetical protein